MILEATDINENRVELLPAVSITFNQDENVPADELVAVIPFTESLCELSELYMYSDSRELLFCGIVDQQTAQLSDSGCFLRIVARSMAALLLDNEALPANYCMPTDYLIYSRYVAPFNIKCADIAGIAFNGEFTVSKGETHWQALNDFCRNVYGTSPKITASGKLYMRGVENDRLIRFSNKNSSDCHYISITENIKRCNIISHILVKADINGGYDMVIENERARGRQINSRRILNGTQSNTPVSCAYKMIENSMKDSYQVTLECAGCMADVLGAKAVVEDFALKSSDELYVSSIKYTLSANAEKTTLVLKRKI